MIHLYGWMTPNTYKISIALEEMGLDYEVKPVNLAKGEQQGSAYQKINPNAKTPTLVDHDGQGSAPVVVFESGAILHYLAEKTGQLLPQDIKAKAQALSWLTWQMSTLGPMFAEAFHFRQGTKQKHPYAINRYTREVMRICVVLEKQLRANPYIAGEDFSIADIAIFPWMKPCEKVGFSFKNLDSLEQWLKRIESRDAVQRGLDIFKVAHKAA